MLDASTFYIIFYVYIMYSRLNKSPEQDINIRLSSILGNLWCQIES